MENIFSKFNEEYEDSISNAVNSLIGLDKTVISYWQDIVKNNPVVDNDILYHEFSYKILVNKEVTLITKIHYPRFFGSLTLRANEYGDIELLDIIHDLNYIAPLLVIEGCIERFYVNKETGKWFKNNDPFSTKEPMRIPFTEEDIKKFLESIRSESYVNNLLDPSKELAVKERYPSVLTLFK